MTVSTQKSLYPMEFSLHRIRKPWGGWPNKIGEIWSLSGPPHDSIVLNGFLAGRKLTEIVGEFQQRLLGANMELDPREPFPMLIKFVSAGMNYPVQVHPDDAYTLEKGLPMVGRDKIWYVLHAEQESRIHLGFRDPVRPRRIREAAQKGDLHRLMNALPVATGDLYTIPAGRIHAVGKGVTLFEIQNHSSLVFELCRREGEDPGAGPRGGRPEEYLEVLDLNPVTPRPIRGVTVRREESVIKYLAVTPRFLLRRLRVDRELDISSGGAGVLVYTGLRGSGWLRRGFSETACYVQPYQSIVVPALPEDLFLESDGGLEVLETSVMPLSGDGLDELKRLGLSRDKTAGLGGMDYGHILEKYLR